MFAAFLFHAAKFFFKVIEFQEDLSAVGMFAGEKKRDIIFVVTVL